MPFFYERAHFAAIRAILLAGDVEARVLANADHCLVTVDLMDGSRAVWGNVRSASKIKRPGLGISTNGDHVLPAPWGLTVVPEGGEGEVLVQKSDLPHDATPEDVARLIATWEYQSLMIKVAVDG